MGQQVAAENAQFKVWQKRVAAKVSREKSLNPIAHKNGNAGARLAVMAW
jgi:hypothetical protein